MLLTSLLACATAPTPEGSPPSVLFITVDTTRVDDIGYFGGEAATPNIDALLDDSMVLERHHSCSGWTYTSMICLSSGATPLERGFLPRLDTIQPVPEDTRLAAERLSSEGWRTGLITTNPYIAQSTQLARGFQRYDERVGAPAGEVTDAALAMLYSWDAGDEQPWYLHVHYIDPHDPYAPPAEWFDVSDLAPIDFDLTVSGGYDLLDRAWPSTGEDERALALEHLRRRYRGELAYFDAELGRLLDTLEGAGWLEDTAVVLVSDHGEQLFDHGEHGHEVSLHREENASVASIRWPTGGPGWWDEPTTHQDIWPTLLEGLGEAPLTQASGLPVGQAAPDRPLTLLRVLGKEVQAGLVRGDQKLLFSYGPEGTSETALYDVAADPYEQADQSAINPDGVEAMRALLNPSLEALTDLGAFAPPR